MRVVMIGGTGHVGAFLVLRPVMEGHELIAVSRQKHTPYESHKAWRSAKPVQIDRKLKEKKRKSLILSDNLVPEDVPVRLPF